MEPSVTSRSRRITLSMDMRLGTFYSVGVRRRVWGIDRQVPRPESDDDLGDGGSRVIVHRAADAWFALDDPFSANAFVFLFRFLAVVGAKVDAFAGDADVSASRRL